MSELSVNHLLGIKYITKNDIDLIFETADHFKEVINRPIKKVPSLRDVTIANLFFENSTRTKLSFELAEKRLSADVINFSAAQSSVKKGETLIDTVNNILSMKVDMVVMRHPNPGAGVFLSKHIKASIINAGDGTNEHPTQALLDAFTIKRFKGYFEGLRVVICGDVLHSRVARSTIKLLSNLGCKVRIVTPPTLVTKDYESWLKDSWGADLSCNLKEGIKDADVVMMLRIQQERMTGCHIPSLSEYFKFYGLNHENIILAKDDVLVMHPGPINRDVEISSSLADDKKYSVILDQVESGVLVRQAVLKWLLG